MWECMGIAFFPLLVSCVWLFICTDEKGQSWGQRLWLRSYFHQMNMSHQICMGNKTYKSLTIISSGLDPLSTWPCTVLIWFGWSSYSESLNSNANFCCVNNILVIDKTSASLFCSWFQASISLLTLCLHFDSYQWTHIVDVVNRQLNSMYKQLNKGLFTLMKLTR